MGHLGHVSDIPSSPRTLGWEGQRDLGTLARDTWDMSGISQVVPGLCDGKECGIWVLYDGMGCFGISQVVPDGKDRGILGTLARDTCDMSGISQVVLGLWDGKDRGIWAFQHGIIGTCLGYPK